MSVEFRREGLGLGEVSVCFFGFKGGVVWLGGWGYCFRFYLVLTLVMVVFVFSGGRWIGVGS